MQIGEVITGIKAAHELNMFQNIINVLRNTKYSQQFVENQLCFR